MYTLFSVDDHIVEPADVWQHRVAAKHREAAPHVIEEAGREYRVYEGERQVTMGLNAVHFPTLPGFGGRKFIGFRDQDLAKACVEAWNDFLLDEWCGADPDMFVPMTIVPLWDVALAVAELNRTLAKGSKVLCFVEDPGALGVGTWHDGTWDPLMQLCAETETPVCMHVGSAGSSTLDPGTTPKVEIAAAFAHTGRAAVNVTCSPVPRKFPDIKFVCFRFPMTVPADARLGI